MTGGSEDPLDGSRRIVVKIGSSLLIEEDGSLDRAWLEACAGDVAALRAEGREVLLVSSGAVALGRRRLGLPARGALDLEIKQAAAAAGQSRLMGAWEEAFERRGVAAAQILLTRDDTEVRRRWLNGRATAETLLRLGAVPVVNENDTVATEEIRFGDNDRLAARVAQMISADLLILFSDVDGLYTADPRSSPEARHLEEVGDITPAVRAMAGGALAGGPGTGGMATKLEAAAIARRAGCATLIARGRPDGAGPGPLEALRRGGRRTRFAPEATPAAAKKHWIAGALAPQGALVVDPGAAAALREGRSLLPAGVTELEGSFDKGDAVLIIDAGRRPFAKGLAAYPHHEARRILGLRSEQLEGVLGYRGPQALVHRNDLVLID